MNLSEWNDLFKNQIELLIENESQENLIYFTLHIVEKGESRWQLVAMDIFDLEQFFEKYKDCKVIEFSLDRAPTLERIL